MSGIDSLSYALGAHPIFTHEMLNTFRLSRY